MTVETEGRGAHFEVVPSLVVIHLMLPLFSDVNFVYVQCSGVERGH